MANVNLLKGLLFFKLTNYALASLFVSDKKIIIETLEDLGLANIIRKRLNPIQRQTLENSDCHYYDIEEFNKIQIANAKSFSFIHQNIRSLPKNGG